MQCSVCSVQLGAQLSAVQYGGQYSPQCDMYVGFMCLLEIRFLQQVPGFSAGGGSVHFSVSVEC